jgi:hypothetical protein
VSRRSRELMAEAPKKRALNMCGVSIPSNRHIEVMK